MSTLTKVLIVLLTVFSIFLCGIVVTYVANAENQRARADGMQQDLRAAREAERDALATLEKDRVATEDLKKDLEKQIAQMKVMADQLQGQVTDLKRENAQLVQEVTNMGAAVKLANETASKLRDQSQTAETEVRTLRADQTNRTKELNELNQMLLERMAVNSQLEAKNRQLVESNQDLETRLNQVLQQYGRAPVRPQPATAQRSTAQPAQPAPAGRQPQPSTAQVPTRDIGLNGRVTKVDLKNRLAEISIGAASGVRQDMKFHVTRGDRFVCDILILDVDPEKAVGILDLVQVEPQAGDNVTTNL